MTTATAGPTTPELIPLELIPMEPTAPVEPVLIGAPDPHSGVLVSVKKANALEVFTNPKAMTTVLAYVAEQARAHKPDMSTAKGRAAVGSNAYKVAQTKTYLDGMGKTLVDDYKELPKKVDAIRRTAREFLDALRDEVRSDLTKHEAETARLEAERIATEAAAALAIQIEAGHEVGLLMNREHDRLAEDRKIAAEKAQEERDEKIRTEAAEKARLAGIEKARLEIANAELATANAKLATERAEAATKAAEDRAAQAKMTADREARENLAAEALKVKADEEARAANQEHRRGINGNALSDLLAAVPTLTRDQAIATITAIALGKVRAVAVTY